MINVNQPAITKLVEAAARKGIVLDIRPIPSSASTAELVATAFEAEIGQVVTAIVFVADRGWAGLAPVVYLASGRNFVDPCLLAALAGVVSLRAATDAEALALIGHSPGHIPPFGFGHAVRTLMDGDLRRYQWVWAPAGSAGAAFRMSPRTLMALAGAVIVPAPLQTFADPSGLIERRHSSDRRHPFAIAGVAAVAAVAVERIPAA